MLRDVYSEFKAQIASANGASVPRLIIYLPYPYHILPGCNRCFKTNLEELLQ